MSKTCFFLRTPTMAAIISVENVSQFLFLAQLQQLDGQSRPDILACRDLVSSSVFPHQYSHLCTFDLPFELECDFFKRHQTPDICVERIFSLLQTSKDQTTYVEKNNNCKSSSAQMLSTEWLAIYEYLQAKDSAKSALLLQFVRETTAKIESAPEIDAAMYHYLQFMVDFELVESICTHSISIDPLLQALVAFFFNNDGAECYSLLETITANFMPLLFQKIAEIMADCEQYTFEPTLDKIVAWMYPLSRHICRTNLLHSCAPGIFIDVSRSNSADQNAWVVSLHQKDSTFAPAVDSTKIQISGLRCNDVLSNALARLIGKMDDADYIKYAANNDSSDNADNDYEIMPVPNAAPKQIDATTTLIWIPENFRRDYFAGDVVGVSIVPVPNTVFCNGDMIDDTLLQAGNAVDSAFFCVAGGSVSRALRHARPHLDMCYSDVDLYVFAETKESLQAAIESLCLFLEHRYAQPVMAYQREQCFTIHTQRAKTLLQVQAKIVDQPQSQIYDVLQRYDLSHATCSYTQVGHGKMWSGHLHGWISNVFRSATHIMQSHENFIMHHARFVKAFHMGFRVANHLHQANYEMQYACIPERASLWMRGAMTAHVWLHKYMEVVFRSISAKISAKSGTKRDFDLISNDNDETFAEWIASFQQRSKLKSNTLFVDYESQVQNCATLDQILTVENIITKQPYTPTDDEEGYSFIMYSSSLYESYRAQLHHSIKSTVSSNRTWSDVCNFTLINVLFISAPIPRDQPFFWPAGYFYTTIHNPIVEKLESVARQDGFTFSLNVPAPIRDAFFGRIRNLKYPNLDYIRSAEQRALILDAHISVQTRRNCENILTVRFVVTHVLVKKVLDQLQISQKN